MGIRSKSRGTKNPPIFSHEFVIQNHEDIISCVAMVFIVGLMFQVSAPLASKFIVMHHNVSSPEPSHEADQQPAEVLYTSGRLDLCVLFFYTLICILLHDILQEFVIDKLNKKLHLSKTKHSRFIESGQLIIFYLISAVWGSHIILRENIITNITSLWADYPESHVTMTFLFKLFFIIQIAYWIHTFPELYFQKVKREEWAPRIQYAVLYLVFIIAAYVTSFTRITLVLLVVHYTAECLIHAARMLHYAEKVQLARKVFSLYNVVFTLARLVSVIGAVLTFWYGLALTQAKATAAAAADQQTDADSQTADESGVKAAGVDFNTQTIRMTALSCVLVLQAWLMWHFINYHLRRLRELATLRQPAKKPVLLAASAKKDKKNAKKSS